MVRLLNNRIFRLPVALRGVYPCRVANSISVKEAAVALKVSRDTLYRWRQDGIALPSGWSWDDVPGRRLRLVLAAERLAGEGRK